MKEKQYYVIASLLRPRHGVHLAFEAHGFGEECLRRYPDTARKAGALTVALLPREANRDNGWRCNGTENPQFLGFPPFWFGAGQNTPGAGRPASFRAELRRRIKDETRASIGLLLDHHHPTAASESVTQDLGLVVSAALRATGGRIPVNGRVEGRKRDPPG